VATGGGGWSMWQPVGVVRPLGRGCGASWPMWKTVWGGGPTWRSVGVVESMRKF
jgi:hypothetical protein